MQYPLRQGDTNGTPGLRQGSAPGVDSPLQTPRTVTQIPGHGIHSNAIINHHYLMQRNGIADQLINTGQFVFILKHQVPVRTSAKTFTLVNLPMLNWHLAHDEARGNEKRYKNVGDVLDHWSPQGVVVNSQGGEPYQGNQRNQSKIVNLTVSGWSQTMNVWGPIADGDCLYLVVKRVKLPAGTRFNLNVGDSGRILQEETECFQVVPTSIKPEFGVDVVSIHIGRVFRSKRMTSLSKPNAQITRDVPLMVRSAEQFEFLVNIKRPRVHL